MSHQQNSNASDPYQHQSVQPPPANRRSFMKWLTHGLGTVFAVALAVPGVSFLIDPRHRQAAAGDFQDLVPLDDLTIGEPQEFVVRQTFRDGPVLYPNEIAGRVIVVRKGDREVEAFDTTCPHLGCSIKIDRDPGPDNVAFHCPCHQGRFNIDGGRIQPNPATRDMYKFEGPDELRIDEKTNMVQLKYKKPD